MTDTKVPSAGRTGAVYVCPLSAVSVLAERAGASHLITLLQDEIHVERPHTIRPDRHLRLHVHDICEPIDGCILPDRPHIDDIVAFVHEWGGQGPLIVHCWAGISRSTAAAFAALCALNPDTPEDTIAALLRQASPTAYPNRRMIQLADEALGRNGRMVRAIEAIGRGVVANEAVPFFIAADLSKTR